MHSSFSHRVVSGMRPTGLLHIGHYFGALSNWVRLQNERPHQCYFFSADWHALTTGYRDTEELVYYREQMIIDWIACGIDPERVVIFSQATIPEHGELAILLGMITPVPWLERVPSYKEVREALQDRDLSTIGFLNYPLLQTADIAMYLGTHVPVGEDQLAHLELGREVIRRFNNYYATVFPEAKGLITPFKRIMGLDGRKMSKSYQNAIYLSEPAEKVKKKVMPAPTDPARIKRSDPGTPQKCNIYAYQELLQDQDKLAEIDNGCRTAGIGCVDCKKMLITALEDFRQPILSKRNEIVSHGNIKDIIANGNQLAREQAQQTMKQVREAMKL